MGPNSAAHQSSFLIACSDDPRGLSPFLCIRNMEKSSIISSSVSMALAYNYSKILLCKQQNVVKIKCCKITTGEIQTKKRCLRCNSLYLDKDNSPTACFFHGHTTGEKGLFALAPPHQGIDGEWSDRSGVIVYKWSEKDDRPNTGRDNWKKRWSCCAVYDENAPPCRRGWHVCYDDGFTLY